MAASARPRDVQSATCPVRELSSPRVDQSARCPRRELAIRELAYPRVVQVLACWPSPVKTIALRSKTAELDRTLKRGSKRRKTMTLTQRTTLSTLDLCLLVLVLLPLPKVSILTGYDY